MIIGIGFPFPLKINNTIGNGNGKEWESPCMGMGIALIPMGINSHQRMQCLAYVIVTSNNSAFDDNSAPLNVNC